MPKRILIVGGVAGGAACAARLRRLDEQAEITIFQRDAEVSFANCGLPYHIGGVIPERQKLLVTTPDRFREWLNIEVCTRREVKAIDRKAKTVEVLDLATGQTTTVGYDVLVLAPGARPVRPRIAGVEKPGVFVLRSMEDMDRIQAWLAQHTPTRAIVVGGGYIGLEMVENLARRGLSVTLLEQLPQVMPPMDPEMIAPAHEVLRRHGVELQLSGGVTAIESDEQGQLAVLTKDGGRIAAGIVLLAVGVRPDADLARQAGLKLGATGGIRVNPQMRTSDTSIYAVGDAVEVRDRVTGQPTLLAMAGVAARQGRVAADAICGRKSRFRGVLGTAVVGVFDLTVAMTGASERRLQAAGIRYQKSYTHSLHHADYYPGAEMMAVKLLFEPKRGRLFGAQAVGRAGVDKRIDVIAAMIEKGGTVFDLEDVELCYAPQYGSAKDPINIAGAVAANVLRGDVDLVQWDQWFQLHQAGNLSAVVLDVRTEAERAAAVVHGSIHIPLSELRHRLGELSRDQEYWVHCGIGQRAYYASRILRQHGFRVRNLSGGEKSYQSLPKPS